MSGFVDLHIHSDRSSDGDFSPAELLGMARESGFAVISIADHDTVAAYPEAVEAAEGSGVEVIPSMEVTTLFDGREFHVLLPFLDWESPVVARIAARVSEGRFLEARERVEKLRALGVDITWEDVEAGSQAARPRSASTIAQILLEKPESRRIRVLRKYYHDGKNRAEARPISFYRTIFMEGKPALPTNTHLPLLDVLEMAPGARSGSRACPSRRLFPEHDGRTTSAGSKSAAWPASKFIRPTTTGARRLLYLRSPGARPRPDGRVRFPWTDQAPRRLRVRQRRPAVDGGGAPEKEAVTWSDGWISFLAIILLGDIHRRARQGAGEGNHRARRRRRSDLSSPPVLSARLPVSLKKSSMILRSPNSSASSSSSWRS